MLRVPMNGQYGISSRVFDWSPELKQRAKDNVALYKRLREIIAGRRRVSPHSASRPRSAGGVDWRSNTWRVRGIAAW